MPAGTDNHENFHISYSWAQHTHNDENALRLCIFAPLRLCIFAHLHLCAFALKAFSEQQTRLPAPITMALCARFAKKKLQSGKVAKLHVVNPATLQPCNPVILTPACMMKKAHHNE
jgi:hypothetical protein